MAFNSYQFILLFLPLAVVLNAILLRLDRPRLRVLLLIALTVGFYCAASWRSVPIMAASLAANFVFARKIGAGAPGERALWLRLGVCANVALLVGLKYTDFLGGTVAALAGGNWTSANLLLPLGISFFTFQQIAFLVDTSRGTIARPDASRYVASILFFPILVSGPITYFRDLAPQFDARPDARERAQDRLIGLVLFSVGLFKKTVIADTLGLFVDPLFAQAARDVPLSGPMAWAAATGFLLQMYFDFSGYSDMACGIARMLGICLPRNFHSPLRVTSVIAWWRRWHMSLGRFVGDYIHQPLAIGLGRWAARRGFGRDGMQVMAVLVPTFLTMLVIGAWHGGNWTFVVFGVLHGTYMVVAESWRYWRKRRKLGPMPAWTMPLFNLLTLFAVLVAVVPFRAADMPAAIGLWQSMAGMASPGALVPHDLPASGMAGLGAIIACCLFIAYLLPNSMQWLEAWSPTLATREWQGVSRPAIRLAWRPGPLGGIAAGLLFVLGFVFIARGSASFVYFGY